MLVDLRTKEPTLTFDSACKITGICAISGVAVSLTGIALALLTRAEILAITPSVLFWMMFGGPLIMIFGAFSLGAVDGHHD